MEPYRVAETYDPLTLLPYEEIAAHFTGRIRTYRPNLRTILDVACGTGNLTIPMARLGYEVSGLDVAPNMLAIAREKAPDVEFVCQDMRDRYPGKPVDAVTCFFGALNFLTTGDALRQAFASMFHALEPGGVLAFDLFSPNTMRTLFTGTRAADHRDFYAVTRSDTAGDQITHHVTFFLRDADGRYRREEELHRLRIHRLPQVQDLLSEAGFEPLAAEPFHPHVAAAVLRDVSLVIARRPDGQ